MLLLTGVVAVIIATAWGFIELAAWAASGEAYLRVAPFKRSDMVTLMSMDDYERNLRAMRAQDEYRRERGHPGQWNV